MLRIFDLKGWWTLPHDLEQMETVNHINFEPISGHIDLFVADVNSSDEIILKLLGCTVVPYIGINLPNGSEIGKFLYKKDNKYFIVEILQALVSD